MARPLPLAFLLLVACKEKPVEKAPENTEASDTGGLPDAICTEGTRWEPGSTAFRDASADWGITEIMPVGTRISAVDLDGDGWTDLIVRGNSGVNDFEAGTRSIWILRNTGEGRFEDITEASGATMSRDGDRGRAVPIWAFGDIDNDGDLDAYTGAATTADARDADVVLNKGDGSFAFGPEESEALDHRPSLGGASLLDFDRDGQLDLWLTSYADSAGNPAQDRLYRGDGTGAFTDATDDAGLVTEPWASIADLNNAEAHTSAWSAAACDLNNDGWPELLSSSYGRAPNHLWRAGGDGAYINESIASGYAFDHRTDWTDNESARCWCTLHPEDEDCAGVPEPELIRCETDDDAFRWYHLYDREPFRLGGNSGATVCADVDNDGWFDLLTTEIVHWDVGSSSDPSELLFNEQSAEVRFSRPGNEVTGLTREHNRQDWNDGDITASIFDFDNDGWSDVWIGSTDYPGATGLLWHQQSPRSFVAVEPEDGIEHPRSHGSAVADFDRDGDLDIVVGHSSARCERDCRDTFEVRLFENTLGQDGNFVQVQLVGGEGSNRSAIGARIDLTTPDGITQSRQVGGGFGQWGAQDDLVQHFGLGSACEAEITITWPDAAATTQAVSLVSGYRFKIEQGAAQAAVIGR